MAQRVKNLLAAIGGLFLAVLLVLGAVSVYWLMDKPAPAEIILEVDLDREFIEYIPNDPIAMTALGGKQRVRDFVEALERAADDDRVTGMIARVGKGAQRLGTLQELRNAIFAFRESGKPAIAYADTIGEGAAGNASYYLATAFDEVYVQPGGLVALTGLGVDRPFLSGALETVGIAPRFDTREEYKTAPNMFTEPGYTQAHREQDAAILMAQFAQFTQGISDGRGLSEDAARNLVAHGPFQAATAAEAGLIDGLKYRDEAYDRIRELAGENGELLYLGRYLQRTGRLHDQGPRVALIHASGLLMRGPNGFDPLLGEITMGAETVAKAFRDAMNDDEVAAILFRIDSPGGSVVGSESIHREVNRAREKGIPVIAAMGGVAASGGYYVAMGADHIVAQPATVTGSIGVYTGKPVFTNAFWERLRVNWDGLQTSDNAGLWSPLHDVTSTQQERVAELLDGWYEQFTSNVAEHRGMAPGAAAEWAKGRVFMGEEALDLGLVDSMGGYPEAIRVARELAGLAEDEPIEIKEFPPPKSLDTMLLELFVGKPPEHSEEPAASTRALREYVERTREMGRLLRELGVVSPGGAYYAPVPQAIR
ncbi:MAG: S49 family peptidase [Candidatus Hydrogenedentota bacterium]